MIQEIVINRNHITELLAQILQLITERYVMYDLPIPEKVLSLKDEACSIAEKAAEEHNTDVIGEYERRLSEILGSLEHL